METTAFFEKKISITPAELNKVKTTPLDYLILEKAKSLVEEKCSEHGFVLPGTVKLLSKSLGYYESARFTGDTVYYVKLQAQVIYPADGVKVIGEVIRKNKMGLYIDYRNAIRIQVPRDLYIGSDDYENVEIKDMVEVELKLSKFQINDAYISANGLFIRNTTAKDADMKIAEVEESGITEELTGIEEGLEEDVGEDMGDMGEDLEEEEGEEGEESDAE
jgi:hypothetical protein